MNYEIYCINLINRKDRLNRMKNIFNKLDIIDKVNFHIVEKHKYGSRYGCFNSHLECLEKAKSDYIIIFEDDCILNTNFIWNDLIKTIDKYFKNPSIEYFSIGCIPISILPINLEDNIIKGKFTTTLCYAIKKKTFLRLKNKMLKDITNIHIDHFYFTNISNSIGFKTPYFIQNFNDTDNLWTNDILYEKELRDTTTDLYKKNNLIPRIITYSGIFIDTTLYELKHYYYYINILIIFILLFILFRRNY